MLTFFEAVVLGIVQGVAEWLPVSSEGVASLIMINFFGKSISEAIPIAIWLHMGTLLAALVYFREEVLLIIRKLPDYFSKVIFSKVNSGKKEQEKPSSENSGETNLLISFLIISTFLTGCIGLPIMLFVTEAAEVSGELATAAVGIFLILTGLFQRISADTKNSKKIPDTKDALLVGAAQGFSAFPGISRSGITVAALLFRDFDSERALKFSFLMSIPAVLGAEIGIGIMDLIAIDIPSLLALIFSFVFGLLTINFLLKVTQKVNFSNFCIILGFISVLSLLL
ncbi:undecaprenyl-diphosphate phosphatase [Methanosarcina sp. KYL-1]|uniref:undecaprenyl-diphosphate phosphatase n=1 Tax=Methanosarcina sp. KYL-1 TaxID=2602068 RepID=UPI002101B660|nr:undecaprenyl-diphosphate phosphatase [Methanosarcina sp. KYL-1]MCQ1534308.1 undecaprenyl-diphosphate phosphatase [Methanosarcina sp. KYL-1]